MTGAQDTARNPTMLPAAPKYLEGFVFGERLPALMFHLRMVELPQERRDSVARHLITALIGNAETGLAGFDSSAGNAVEYFLRLVDHIQGLADLPLLSRARIVRFKGDLAECIAPTLLRGLTPLASVVSLLNQYLALPEDELASERLKDMSRQVFRRLKETGLGRTNPTRLLKAALELEIPFVEISHTITQYGIGKKSVLMDSTSSDRTSAIGTVLAKYKLPGSHFLRRMGLPVAANRQVADEEDAVKAAAELGYPVVVKPGDRDGGIGVAADLRTPEEVRAAYAAARKSSECIMVESFVPGRDYRMVVFQGRLVWAVEREPGGVTGDGHSTVAQLVEIANRDPHRGNNPSQPMKPLILDEEARHLLTRAGVDENSVLPVNQFVRIRRAANVATGGKPVAVFDKVHPDNAALAIQAAEAFRLDLAGIDLLLPDISVSWQVSGGAICEVNSQPQLGGVTSGHLYGQILTEMVGGSGKVPVLAVMGKERAARISNGLAESFPSGKTVGRHGRLGVWLGPNRIIPGQVPILQAGRFLAGQRALDAIILGIWDASVLRSGLPLPRIDILTLSGEAVPLPDNMKNQSQAGFMARIFQLIAANCEKIVLTTAPADCAPELIEALALAGCQYDVMDENAIANGLLPEPATAS